jgi:transposase
VRVPNVAEEDDRRLHRERGRLINERIQHVNRIKGLLAPSVIGAIVRHQRDPSWLGTPDDQPADLRDR